MVGKPKSPDFFRLPKFALAVIRLEPAPRELPS